MAKSPEVVITGVGVVCPIGIGVEAYRESLRAQCSGIGPVTRYPSQYLPAPIAGEIDGFDPKAHVKPRKSLKMMCREIQTAFTATSLALENSGPLKGVVDPDRLGVVFGAEMLNNNFFDLEDAYRSCIVDGQFVESRWGANIQSQIFPLWMLKHLPNMPACHVGIVNDARGPNNSITLEAVSSLLAVSEGTDIIRRGDADAMIIGGAGSRSGITALLCQDRRPLSPRFEEPEKVSRPFDADRDGMVVGEGSATFILEREASAKTRGATVLARVLACSSAFEPVPRGQSLRGDAIRRSIRDALQSAGLQASDIGHVNAHGLSTVHDDIVEAAAIHDELGDVPVTAPKSFFGYLGAGSGAVEMVASLLAFEKNEIPVTLNYETPDPQCPVNVVHGKPLATTRPTAMILSQNAAGQAAAVILAGP